MLGRRDDRGLQLHGCCLESIVTLQRVARGDGHGVRDGGIPDVRDPEHGRPGSNDQAIAPLRVGGGVATARDIPHDCAEWLAEGARHGPVQDGCVLRGGRGGEGGRQHGEHCGACHGGQGRK